MFPIGAFGKKRTRGGQISGSSSIVSFQSHLQLRGVPICPSRPTHRTRVQVAPKNDGLILSALITLTMIHDPTTFAGAATVPDLTSKDLNALHA